MLSTSFLLAVWASAGHGRRLQKTRELSQDCFPGEYENCLQAEQNTLSLDSLSGKRDAQSKRLVGVSHPRETLATLLTSFNNPAAGQQAAMHGGNFFRPVIDVGSFAARTNCTSCSMAISNPGREDNLRFFDEVLEKEQGAKLQHETFHLPRSAFRNRAAWGPSLRLSYSRSADSPHQRRTSVNMHDTEEVVSSAKLHQLVAESLARSMGSTLEVQLPLAIELLGGDNISMFSVEQGASVEAFADALALYHRLKTSEDRYMSLPLSTAMDVLGDAFRLYGLRGVFTSFNGGKDAVVIMHLSRAVHAKHCVAQQRITRPRMIFFESEGDFPEVMEFVDKSEAAWDLELLRYSEGFVKGLKRCITQEGGAPLGFVLGTRRGDPNCGEQGRFEPSSDWMPPFMRVNPIVEWDYGHIWHFLRLFQLPYCELYDQGYTSLGLQADSWPNPALRKNSSGTSESSFWPAYMLSDWALERAGRGKRKGSDEFNPESTECEFVDIEARRSRARTPTSAALVIIGDEILKGKCCDTNAPFAAKELRAAGVPLQRIVTVPDDLDCIAEELRSCMQSYDLVVTSGGLGPTHDDVTIHAVADALGQQLQTNDEMYSHLSKMQGKEEGGTLSEELAKMAKLPELSRLLWPPGTDEGGKQKWPLLQCNNIFVLPGVPQFFEGQLRDIADNFVEAQKVHACKVVLSIEESSIVSLLNSVVEEHQEVNFGSYPFVGNQLRKTAITLEGDSQDLVDAALEGLVRRLPDGSILRVEQDDTLT